MPGDLYEAAKIDGASPVQLFAKITVPFMIPTINVAFVMVLKSGICVFDFIQSMTAGGPMRTTEAACIDGCTTTSTFFKIVYPLAKPMTVTIIILNTLWIWNDFLLPLLILNKSAVNWTLPLYQYNFKSAYTFDYNLAFASFLFSIVP